MTHALLVGEDVALHDLSALYLSSEQSRDLFRGLKQLALGQKPRPLFAHLRPRSAFGLARQRELWNRTRACQ